MRTEKETRRLLKDLRAVKTLKITAGESAEKRDFVNGQINILEWMLAEAEDL